MLDHAGATVVSLLRILALLAVVSLVLIAGGLRAPVADAAGYTVQDGDTMSAIAAKFGISADRQADWIAAVVALNGLANADSLAVGESLTLPDQNTNSAYTVQDGDTMLAIAAKLAIPTDQQADWIAAVVALNHLAGPDTLVTGQVLNLNLPGSADILSPVSTAAGFSGQTSYTVGAGDTLLAIAAGLGISPELQSGWIDAVVTLNGLQGPDTLTAGQVIELPQASATGPAPSPPPPPPPTPTPPTPTPTPPSSPSQPDSTATQAPSSGDIVGKATPYSDSLAGNPLGCAGAGRYDPADMTVIALGPALHNQIPCGTKLEVCGPQACLTGASKDYCPGCGPNDIDVSRAAFVALCGAASNSCTVHIKTGP